MKTESEIRAEMKAMAKVRKGISKSGGRPYFHAGVGAALQWVLGEAEGDRPPTEQWRIIMGLIKDAVRRDGDT